jgi:hypothetical protein
MALGGIVEGNGATALLNQEAALESLILRLEHKKHEVANKRRVAEAEETRDKRLKPGDRSYGVHMRHCYGLSDDPMPGMEGVERFSCKYGEDDICPAALFEDPWAEWTLMCEAGKNKTG